MSNKINDGGPAFPSKLTGPCEAYGLKADATQVIEFPGMTLRDYAAIEAMKAVLTGHFAHYGHENYWPRNAVASEAYEMADEVLKARNT